MRHGKKAYLKRRSHRSVNSSLLNHDTSSVIGRLYRDEGAMSQMVESRMVAVAWALRPTLRFPSPLIKPDEPISGIRLSDWLHRKAHGDKLTARGFGTESNSPSPLEISISGGAWSRTRHGRAGVPAGSQRAPYTQH
jgi:hypothetical protein